MMKTCKRCGVTKPEDEFPWRWANGKRARRARCKACCSVKRDPEKVRACRQRSYARHADSVKAKRRAYYQTDAGKTAARKGNLKHYGVTIGHSEADWRRLLVRYQGRCAYCGAPATERDHVIPLSRGGSDSIGNILPACRTCNNSKDKKFLIEWRQAHERTQ